MTLNLDIVNSVPTALTGTCKQHRSDRPLTARRLLPRVEGDDDSADDDQLSVCVCVCV